MASGEFVGAIGSAETVEAIGSAEAGADSA
jgi:hypothetical protein